MSAVVFPSSPSVDDVHVAGDITWRWDGVSWVSNSTFNGVLPAGRTDQRPADPKIGMIRYNSDIDAFEGYDGLAWRPFYGTIITTPVGTSPAAAAVLAGGTTFTLASDDNYFNALGLSHASSDWQISSSPAFGTTVVNISADAVNLTSYAVTGGISTAGTYYWRVRYRDSSGNESAYSTAIEFEVLAAPLALGDSYCGGFYIGTICAASTCYYLIVAPNSSGCACCQWKTTRTATSGATSCIDGRANTYGPLNNVTHPAGNWTATRTINGFSDWYLPSRDELAQLYTNASTLPVGQRFPNVPPGVGCPVPFYWTSTSCNTLASSGVWTQRFDCGFQSSSGLLKTNFFRLRAVRRHPV